MSDNTKSEMRQGMSYTLKCSQMEDMLPGQEVFIIDPENEFRKDKKVSIGTSQNRNVCTYGTPGIGRNRLTAIREDNKKPQRYGWPHFSEYVNVADFESKNRDADYDIPHIRVALQKIVADLKAAGEDAQNWNVWEFPLTDLDGLVICIFSRWGKYIDVLVTPKEFEYIPTNTKGQLMEDKASTDIRKAILAAEE